MGKTAILEWTGIGLLVLALLFTLLYSFGYDLDMSNHDYLYYMHLVAEEDYSRDSMIAGTLALFKPVYEMLGRKYWLWQKLTWLMNALIVLIPYFVLLKPRQQRRYTFFMVLAVLVAQQRFGLEPYKPTYLLLSIMLTCLVKYVADRRFLWVFIISVTLSLIVFLRFPSVFVYLLLVLAVGLLNYSKSHTLAAALIPPALFCYYITLTNGGISEYFQDLTSNVGAAATGGHSIGNIFMADVQSIVHECAYALFFIMPFVIFALWKAKQQNRYKTGFILSGLVVTAIMLYHPTQRLSCALMMCVVMFYCYGRHFSRDSIVLSATVIIAAMFNSIGSDCGFVHDYMSIGFLPWFVCHTPSINSGHRQVQEQKDTINHLVNSGLFRRLFFAIVLLLTISTFASRIILICNKYSDNGQLSFCNGSGISANLDNVYFSKNSYQYWCSVNREYIELSKVHDGIIFWGFCTHLMSLANDEWPVTDVWNISSDQIGGKAFLDFKDYITTYFPIVIDTERHWNTESFLSSVGYSKITKNTHNVYLRATFPTIKTP